MNANIVHIGFGAFHRAHQLVYAQLLKTALEKNSSECFPWAYCEISLNSTQDLLALKQQDFEYHVLEQSKGSENLFAVNVISEVLSPKLDGTRAIIEKLSQPEVKIISFTITEKAYGMLAGSEELEMNTEAMQHDLEPENILGDSPNPVTVFGFLAAACHARMLNGHKGVTLLSCDNLRNNGKVLRKALLQYCENIDTKLAEWVSSELSFPCTMVDRIVPKMNAQSRAKIEQGGGQRDCVGVVCESFKQWVIEDDFVSGRPSWETVGAQLVSDVKPYEEMKLRMLNGAHSFIAYAGALVGAKYVSDFIADAEYESLVKYFMLEEQAASLSDFSQDHYSAYANDLLERFKNPHLQHEVLQIAMDGSQKIPQRIVPALLFNASNGKTCGSGVLAIALWLYFVCKSMNTLSQSKRFEDPMAAKFQDIYSEAESSLKASEKIMQLEALFPKSFINNEKLRRNVLERYQELLENGAESVLRSTANRLNVTG